MFGDDSLFHRIFAEVWRSLRLAYRRPLHLTPPPGHSCAALGVPAPVPVIRSWLGGRTSDPPDYRLDIRLTMV